MNLNRDSARRYQHFLDQKLSMCLFGHLIGTRLEIWTPVDVSQLFHQSICSLQKFEKATLALKADFEIPAHCQRLCLSCNLDAGLPSVAPIPEKNFSRYSMADWSLKAITLSLAAIFGFTWRCSVPRSSSCLAFFETASTSLNMGTNHQSFVV